MPLIHAPMCTCFGKHRTNHPSGICSHCRRLKGSKMCSNCGDHETAHPSGLCYRCRSKAANGDDLDNAIAYQKEVLLALVMLKSGYSYRQIGEVIGKSKSAAYALCQSARRHPQVQD